MYIGFGYFASGMFDSNFTGSERSTDFNALVATSSSKLAIANLAEYRFSVQISKS